MSVSVAQVMSVEFVAVTEQMPLLEALVLLAESESTELCVLDEQGRLSGVVTDFDLLKASLSGRIGSDTVESLISRAVTIVPATASLEHVIPLFRDGACSRAYVCREGKVIGRVSRSQILKYLAYVRTETATSQASRPYATVAKKTISDVQPRNIMPPTPQFVTASLFCNAIVERSSIRPRPSV